MGLHQHVRMRISRRGLKLVGRKLEQQSEWILEVNRIHEAAVLHAAVLDLALIQPRDGLQESHARNRKGNVMDTSDIGWGPSCNRPSGFVGEDGDEAAVSRIEIKMALGSIVEVRLFEDKWHAENAFPEVDRCLPVRAEQRDVVNSLRL